MPDRRSEAMRDAENDNQTTTTNKKENVKKEKVVVKSKVTGVTMFEPIHHIRQSLPKWVPTETSNASNGNNDNRRRQRLFTRQEFVLNVVTEVETDVVIPSTWKICISEHHPDDPNLYMLEAMGTKQQLSKLRKQTQAFIRKCLQRCNLSKLIGDKRSLLIDIFLSRKSHAPLGIGYGDEENEETTFVSTSHDETSTTGVWVQCIDPDGRVARAISAEDCDGVYSAGCAVMSINDIDVSHPSVIRNIIEQMTDDADVDQSIKMTLCVSKYADFENVPNIENLNIRRIDGKSYDPNEYERFWFDRYIEMSKLDREQKESCAAASGNGTTVSSSLPETIPNCKKDYICAYKEIMNNPRSAVVNLVLSHRESIGATIAEITTSSVTGLYLYEISPSGQLGTILGKACVDLWSSIVENQRNGSPDKRRIQRSNGCPRNVCKL